METITFSDSIKLSGDTSVTVKWLDESETTITSLEEYCKRNPGAPECREYDV